MKTQIGINQELMAKASFHLSKILADEFVLYLKTRNAHWNVEDTDFYGAHKFFEMQYEFLDGSVDEIAERIRSLGHYAPATLNDYLNLTRLTEQSREANTKVGFIKSLLSDHETVIINLRESIKIFADDFLDAGNSDFVTALMEKHEKMAWMLRAHLR